MNNLAQDLQLHTIKDDNSINSSSIQSKINSFRDFFAEKTALILDNKANSLLYALWLATAVAAVDVATSKDQNINHIEHPTVVAQNDLQYNSNVSVEKKSNLLWYVDQKGNIVIQDVIIREQAEQYYLDYDMFRTLVIKTENVWDELWSFMNQSEYNKMNYNYSYRQLAEALGELRNIEYLISQQGISESKKIAAQRIFNELLRSKQKVIVHGSETITESKKYHLIHDAAGYNYTFVTWEEYDQESMWNVTRKIDNGEYDEEMLISYARELRDYIHYNVWFDMDQYDSYLASIRDANNTSNMIAQNNNIIEEENY